MTHNPKMPHKTYYKNLLIIAQTPHINTLLTREFGRVGYQSHPSQTLKEATAVLESVTIDVVVVELQADEDSGSVVLAIGKLTQVKIIVITKALECQEYERLLSYGVVDYLINDGSLSVSVENVCKLLARLDENKNSTMLLIDSQTTLHDQLNPILNGRGYQLIGAKSGDEALALLEMESIDVILLGMNLPDMEGRELLSILKNIPGISEIVVLALLEADDNQSGKMVKLGANDYLHKPFTFEDFLLKLDTWIDYDKKRRQVDFRTKILDEYKQVIDFSAIVSKTDTKGIITYVNDKFVEISGYSKTELLGRPHNIVRHPDMSPLAFKELWGNLENQLPWTGKVKNLRKDKSYYIVQAYISPIVDANGETIEYISVRTDITESEEMRQALQENLENTQLEKLKKEHLLGQYEDAIATSNAIVITTPSFVITFANKEFGRLSGYETDELVGKNMLELLPEHEQHHADEGMEIISQGKFYQAVFEGKGKNNKIYFTKTTVKPLLDHTNTLYEYLLIMQDITEEKLLEHEILQTQKEVVSTMGAIGETRSKETGLHVKRVAEYSYLLAKLYGLEESEAILLRDASPMHDIGKVGIPDEILNKPARLTPEEYEIMKTHAMLGYEMLKHSTRALLKAAAIVAVEHHEKYNGKGYPHGKVGEDIHIFGRITAIADVFDALGQNRVYKKAWSIEDILSLFRLERGESFDPVLIDLFFENLDGFLRIQHEFQDAPGAIH